jgi:chromate transport protein ChrA
LGFQRSCFRRDIALLKNTFKGVFIGCYAVIFITLIAASSNNKKEILRSTIIVILVKAVISPHSNIAAFFAVLLQGILGYFFFSFSVQ